MTTRRAFLKLAAPLVFVPRLVRPVWANTPDTLYLDDLMDAHYGVGNWQQRGTAAGSGTDIAPAINDGLAMLAEEFWRGGVIYVPPGKWEMNSGPTPSLLAGCTICGETSQASQIWYNASSGAAFDFQGYGATGTEASGGGLKHLGIILESNAGNSTAYAVKLQGSATAQPDQTQFEDLYITGQNASYWYEGFHADGTNRTSPQGIRIADLKNIQIFNCQNLAAYFSNVVGWDIQNLGAYVPRTGTNGADVYVTGGGSSSTNSTEVSISRLNCGGVLHLVNCSSVYAEGQCGGLVNTGTNTFTSNLLT